MDSVLQEEKLVCSLLAPFEQIEPVTRPGHRSRRRRLVAYAILALALIVGGVALAGSLNPLSGIGVADHPRTPNDVLSPDVEAQLRSDRPPSGGVDQIGGRLTRSARFVGSLPSGKRIYVVPTTKGRLCVVVAGLAESCGNPLTQMAPVTFTTFFGHPGEPTYAYGVARDGVRAVSFNLSSDDDVTVPFSRSPGERVTVPVHDNLFAFESDPSDAPQKFTAVTVTLADGTVESAG